MTKKDRARIVLERLHHHIPEPETELDYRNTFELLVAVVLSAQCTDKRVNLVTPALFDAYPTPARMATAEVEEIFPFIRSVSYPNNKAKALAKLARQLVEHHGGQVPERHEELVTLAGVGRKTANVVVAVAFDEPAIAVDTHVFRVSNRIGLVADKPTPLAVEKGLHRVLPKAEWGEAHHLLILLGRYTCTARSPKCERCPLAVPENDEPVCQYFGKLQQLPAPRKGLDKKKGAYFCATHKGYFDQPATREDRRGVEQLACPRCGSMNAFVAKTGATTRRVKDYRIA